MTKLFLSMLVVSTSLTAPALARDGGPLPTADMTDMTDMTDMAADLSAVPIALAAPVPQIRSDADFAQVFTAIKQQRWGDAQAMLANAPSGPLSAMARAELYLAPGSPRVEMGPLLSLIGDAPYLPQAEKLGRLAQKRGAQFLPETPQIRRLSYLGASPRRADPDEIADAAAAGVRSAVIDRIKNDDPVGAETAMLSGIDTLSPSALTEMQQRVAWGYYIENDDGNARRVAAIGSTGTGEWAPQADWVRGLASWRLREYADAAQAFDRVGRLASNEETRAAGLFWSARASVAAQRPDEAQPRLQTAAQYAETFYGILAQEQLGMARAVPMRKPAASARGDNGIPNVRIASALAGFGESAMADDVLRHEAKIGGDAERGDLLAMARTLSLPSTQLYLAHYGPNGTSADPFDRYPAPKWAPRDGWRVDPSLVFAHTLQESRFQANAVSPADARGLMQVRPGTAADLARARGAYFSAAELNRPEVNLEYGQSYLEQLRDMGQTEGLLPKVIAAFNAGPAPVGRWKYEVRDQGDPLLFIESIPYWETRAYVGIILRNYWMYQQMAGSDASSLTGLSQNAWPRFPGMSGPAWVRLNTGRSLAQR